MAISQIGAVAAALCVLLSLTKPVSAAEDAVALYERGQTALTEATQENHRRDGAQLIKRAAEAGHLPAQYHLGFLYGEGLGVARDPQRALHWFRRTA